MTIGISESVTYGATRFVRRLAPLPGCGEMFGVWASGGVAALTTGYVLASLRDGRGLGASNRRTDTVQKRTLTQKLRLIVCAALHRLRGLIFL